MLTRRQFLTSSAALACPAFVRARNANDKLNVAVIGVSNRGAANLDGVKGENVVALCDVDPANAGKAREQFPHAAFVTDYRKLFDSMSNTFDAVVISTPDHTHAHPTRIAAALGKHIYCEKPLCRSVAEVRAVREAVRGKKLVTQMGTQIHAGENYRRVVEIVRSGALGDVRQVYVWNSSRPVGGKRTGAKPSAKFDLDVWLGPAKVEFFEAAMNPSGWKYAWPHFHWRWWWEFGGGTLADLGCHYIDLPFWALGLTAPTKVQAVVGNVVHAGDNDVPDVMSVNYSFPAVGDRGPVSLSWYHGVDGPGPVEPHLPKGFGSGVLFVGSKGKLVADYGKHVVFPEAFAQEFKRPEPTIAKSLGHHAEWLHAIRTGGPTTCNFEYSGALTEAVLLGNVAHRSGQEIHWDAAAAKVTNTPKAAEFLGREDRKGWTV